MYHGLTICTQADVDAKLPDFLAVPGNKWISYEPAWSAVDLGRAVQKPFIGVHCDRDGVWPKVVGPVQGVIAGQDNRRGAPGTDTLDHVRSVVEQCLAAGVPVLVKQIWHMVDGKPKLLRASHPDEYARYPEDLRHVSLPWPTKGRNYEQ